MLACALTQRREDAAKPSSVYLRGSGLVLVNNSFGWALRRYHTRDNGGGTRASWAGFVYIRVSPPLPAEIILPDFSVGLHGPGYLYAKWLS